MRRTTAVIHLCIILALISVPTLLASSSAYAQGATPSATAPITVVASELTNPRGFAWGPDGTLAMAMAGSGGETRIPVSGGFTLRIGLSSSVVTVADGCTAPLQVGLVSTHWEETRWIWGAMDVAYLGDELYVLLGGAGASWRSPSSFSGVYKVNTNRTMNLVADLSTWLPANKPSFIAPDFNPDGSLYGLAAAGDALLVTEAVGGQLIRVTPAGEISRVADLSEGHPVPTGVAVDPEGNAYVGYLMAAPYLDGSAKVVKVTPDGTVTDAWTGLTAITDVAFGPDGTLHVSEMSTGNTTERPFIVPNSGRIVRQTGPDTLEPIVTDLPYPANIGFDPTGRLYLTTPAFGPDAGVGQGAIVSVDPDQAPISYAGFTPPVTCA
jgi:hypothetical protein